MLQPLESYKATDREIKEVEGAIAKQGYWEETFEWKISTTMTRRIEPQTKDGITYYMTTVKCEQEVTIPAKTVKRAIQFMKVYKDFQMELFYKIGWASWAEKDRLD